MSVERRNELIKNIQESIPNLFPFLFKLYDESYAAYKSSQNNPQQAKLHLRLLSALLESGIAFVNDWLSPRYVFEHQFVQIWSVLLQEEDLRMEAAECLRLLVNQKLKPQDIPESWINGFIHTFGKQCFEIIRQPRDQDALLDEYEFHKKV